MIPKNNNNQGVFLQLLVAAKNIIKYFMSLEHKIFSLISSKFDTWKEVKSCDFGCPV